MKHKYAKEIIHWANGGELQLSSVRLDDWHDYLDRKAPEFNNAEIEWRIKPETLRYRVALFEDKSRGFHQKFVETAEDESSCKDFERNPLFVKWTPDDNWIEVEV